ncbi:MAG: P-loop NTPase [Actinobacteria bacterium]|uniref:Unannotated protein n=1 Tax=freshwater metagenome TaxID=449393 RepID=A0A6J6C1K1_9ZZZZ|nr:P-loop NTPase [Actinomycetota bacterium]
MTLIEHRSELATVRSGQRARNVVCWGSAGSGKSTVAVNLSFELASNGWQVCLIDADTYHPSIAALLGITQVAGGLAACLRLSKQNRFNSDEFERLVQQVDFPQSSLRVITGLTSPSRWPEAEPSALQSLIDRLSEEFDYLIWDVASYCEVGLISVDSGRDRNQATQHLLATADIVLALFLADPVGINRLLFDLREVGREVWPVANRVRRSVLGRNPSNQLKTVLTRAAQQSLIGEIWEDEGFDIMLQSTRPLQLQGRPSKAQQGLRKLAQDISIALEE